MVTTRTSDNFRVVVTTKMSRPSIEERLWDAKRNPRYTKICLKGVAGLHGFQQQQPMEVTRDLAEAIVELLHSDSARIWERIDFEHCTGELDLVIAVAMACGRVLSIGFTELTLNVPTVNALATGFKYNRRVSEVCFRRCRIADAAPCISEGIKGNSAIQSITIDQCGLDDETIRTLVNSMMDCANLRKLSLEGNSCRVQALQSLADLLDCNRLQNLSLHNQRLEGSNERLDLSPLNRCLMNPESSLRFLDLSRNMLSDKDVAMIAEALVDNESLETLHLDQNLITDEGACTMATALPSLCCMKTLAMPDNLFREAGGMALVEAIKHNFVMETLIIPSGLSKLQRMIRYYGNLNKGGRRIFSSTNKDQQVSILALFPYVIERVNALRLRHDWNPLHAPHEVTYGLLRYGHVLHEREVSQKTLA